MGQAAEVYAEQLSSLSLGYPLWFPESSETAGEPQIGDVGYVSNGRFWRLFNITVPRDHPWNAFGAPGDYTPFVVPERQHHREDKYLSPNLLHSRSLHAARISSQIGIAGNPLAQAKISYQFECSNEHGAFLALNNKAERQTIDRSLLFEQYIARNHRSWHYFVTQQGVRCEPEELVCVSGWVKTSDWMVAAFLKNEQNHACSIQGQMGPFANVGCEVTITKSNSMSAIYHSGPHTLTESISSPSTAGAQLNDQTIFIEFYKVRYRLRMPKVLKAAMGPSTLPPSDEHPSNSPPTPAVDSDSDGSVELETVSPAGISAKTPLDHVLDYLFETVPHVDIAITSHGHLNDLQRFERLQVDRLAGQDLVQDIRRYPPQVQVVVVENLETVALLVDPLFMPFDELPHFGTLQAPSQHSGRRLLSTNTSLLPTETQKEIDHEDGATWRRKKETWGHKLPPETPANRPLESERSPIPELCTASTPSTSETSSGLLTPPNSLPFGGFSSSTHIRSPLASALARERKQADGPASIPSRFRYVSLSNPSSEDEDSGDDKC